MSVEEMSEYLGVHRNTVGNYLRGVTQPRKLVLQAWAMRCGVPYEWLVTGEISPPPPPPSGNRPPKARRSVRLRGRDSNPQPSGFTPRPLVSIAA